MASIYLLYFSDDSVYIGKTSIGVHIRYARHCATMLNNTHCNYKVQEAYHKFGIPKLILLEDDVPIDSLNELEKQGISEFDSYKNGLNCTEGGDGPAYGEDNPNAKHSLNNYLEIVSMLANTKLPVRQIADNLNISEAIVRHISNEETHTYLQDLVPLEYMAMKNRKVTRTLVAKNYPDIKGPNGIVYSVDNLSKFADEHNLDNSALSKLVSGKLLSCKGYRLASLKIDKVISDTGEIVELPKGTRQAFCKSRGLNSSNLSMLLNNKLKTYKGWSVYHDYS